MQGGARDRAGAYYIVREDAAPKRQRRSRPVSTVRSTPERAISRILCPPFGEHFSGAAVTRGLVRPDPRTRAGHPFLPEGRTSSYLVLLRAGFTVPPWSPSGRWALTPPFHPYPVRQARRGGLFSVALSVPSRGLRVTERPALRSSDFPLRPKPERSSSPLWRAEGLYAATSGNVNGKPFRA
jgi:hypothetical protein